jgi:hypothetical protein
MQKSLQRKIIIGSLVAAFVSLAAGLITALIFDLEPATVASMLLLSFSLLTIISLYALEILVKSWVRKIVKYSLFLFPISGFISVFIAVAYSEYSAGFYVSLIFTLLLLILVLIHLFLYTDAISLTSVIILLSLLIVGIFFKRMHWPLASLIISMFSTLLSAGSFMFGIRCLTLSGKNTYFRNVTFIGSCALSISFLGQMFKLQHWAFAGVLVVIGFTSLIVGTIYVLITLHSSGFIDWQPFYKKILRRILIPWTFIFILYVSRYMVPELNSLIWSPDARKIDRNIPAYGFNMKDYTIENRNGINPE